jgi:transaldolase
MAEQFPSDPLWARLRELGTELCLDTGSLDDAGPIWTRDLSALTTNNTLLNREVQSGRYDDLIGRAAAMLGRFSLTERERTLEIAFILNAYHALRLVEKFDAQVSVEEHTALAHDVPAALGYARRYHAICPERFVVKVPLTPAGLLATRRLSAEGVPVNHTLGFSARQNYVIARLARPRYVNVFMGRLNAFVSDNELGDGALVGERATLASQTVVRTLRRERGVEAKQIGASLREGGQIRDLASLDVLTMPTKASEEFQGLGLAPSDLADRTGEDYRPTFAEGVSERAVGLDTLWDVGDEVVACMDALESEDLDAFGPEDLVAFFESHGCGDLLVRWTDDQVARSVQEGKIPILANWRDALADRQIGLDALMNLAGLNSFAADQEAMDERVGRVLASQ